MDDYSRLGGMQPVGDMPGRIWKIKKKRKPTERKHNRNRREGKETAGKDRLLEKHEQKKPDHSTKIDQEPEFETSYGSIPLKKKKSSKIDLII